MNLYEAFESSLLDEAKTFPLSDDASITLRPTAGDKARRAFEKLMEPYSVRLNSGGELTEEENRKINVKHYANNVITDWAGIKDRAGEDIAFSPEAAEKLLSDKKLEKFFLLIVRMASNEKAFAEARAEDDAGN